MTGPEVFGVLGAVVTVLGAVRLLTTADHLRRVVALNVAGAGTLLVLVSLAPGPDGTDPVLQALALTGIVITVSVTALALVLVRRVEQDDDPAGSPADEEDAGG